MFSGFRRRQALERPEDKSIAGLGFDSRLCASPRLQLAQPGFQSFQPAVAPADMASRLTGQSTVSVRVNECATPSEVAVTGIEYVPAGVIPEPEEGVPPLEIDCATVQLVIPTARMASTATSSNVLRPRPRTNGSSSKPQANGSTRTIRRVVELAVV